MSAQSNHAFSPEVLLADRILNEIPRIGKILEKDLLKYIADSSPPNEQKIFEDHFQTAIEVLFNDKCLIIYPGVGMPNKGKEYSLTETGRNIRDKGSYIRERKAREEKEAFSNQINKAEGKKKIWDNRTKTIVLGITVLGAIMLVLGLWEKYSSDSGILKPQAKNQSSNDSVFNHVQSQPNTGQHSPLSKKLKHDNIISKPTTITVDQSHTTFQPGKKEEKTAPPIVKTSQPIQTITSDNIEFKLMKAIGNTGSQSVTLVLTLTTSAANWYIMARVHSIIDPDGNEYKLKSYTNGLSTYLPEIDLTTGVPLKCTYTFDGILPSVKTIKLFQYSYGHSSGQPFSVEFRDIPIDWK